jgi:hypothetical protein
MRRVSFGVVLVGWKAGALVVAGVVVAGSSARLGCGGNGGEEERCDCEGLHGGLGVDVWLVCCVGFEKVADGIGRVLYARAREAQETNLQ